MGNAYKECVICAYRENCSKRFLKAKTLGRFCPEFCKDILLEDEPKTTSPKKSFFDGS